MNIENINNEKKNEDTINITKSLMYLCGVNDIIREYCGFSVEYFKLTNLYKINKCEFYKRVMYIPPEHVNILKIKQKRTN
jgi:uncharacterized protein YutD